MMLNDIMFCDGCNRIIIRGPIRDREVSKEMSSALMLHTEVLIKTTCRRCIKEAAAKKRFKANKRGDD